jgi:hypothetical protein
MSKSKISLIAALAGMSIASPAFAQSQDRYGGVLPYHYEGETVVWGSWYAQDQGQRRSARPHRRPYDVQAR